MSGIDTGGPAFPGPHFDYADSEHGMTLRDYFAAKAMQGIVSHPSTAMYLVDEYVKSAYAIADAMLKARDAT